VRDGALRNECVGAVWIDLELLDAEPIERREVRELRDLSSRSTSITR